MGRSSPGARAGSRGARMGVLSLSALLVAGGVARKKRYHDERRGRRSTDGSSWPDRAQIDELRSSSLVGRGRTKVVGCCKMISTLSGLGDGVHEGGEPPQVVSDR